ncbi:hypothetical protein [Streptomyces cyaneochromogenes]|nr:hypothetical protein [Streptomyces cyaneochromogenes]
MSASLIRPPGASSSTAWDIPLRNDGLRQVVSRPPNPASATGPAVSVIAR